MPPLNRNHVAMALAMAVERHLGQHYGEHEPYSLHPIRVALRFPPADVTARVVALLHDLVEDTDTTLHELWVYFGPTVQAAVDALTRRAEEPYATYIQRVATHPIARRIKLADLEENFPTAPAHLQDRYAKALHVLKETL